ncbi:MAG TPA: hypothetical protein DEW22_00665 [Clostridiales bacterium]|nr:hypothetical protein [Clostridiales bacterium]
MKKCINGQIVEMSADEIAEIQDSFARAEAAEKKRPLTEAEVSRMIISQQINTLEVDDATAYRMLEFYPEWQSGQSYPVGYKLLYGGKLYRVIQAHTSQDDWTPDASASLFERIDETHDGSKYDPIPYEGNMALESGKYYVQDGVTYLCSRDTGNPVYHALSELVGLYAEKII